MTLISIGRLPLALGKGLAALLTLATLLTAVPSPVYAQTVPTLSNVPRVLDLRGGEMVIPLDKSQVLRVDQPFSGLSVGNPAVADVVALSNRSIYVLGKSLGATNLTIYGPNRRILSVVDLTVGHDVLGLGIKLGELFPTESIEVRSANDSLVLSGTLSTPEQLAQAAAIAESYAPGKVTNLLRVNGSQQVMLQVTIAEVQRRVVRELGIKPEILSGDFIFRPLDAIDPTKFAAALITAELGDVTVTGLIDALEEKGLVKVLAEPNLVALSGDTANFLAGGEFPVPVAQDVDSGALAITVAFKQFGVGLAFTPTVLNGDLINLVVNPEVSQIDPSVSVVLNGFNIPGLSTRRATTTVELRDGQSFAIAGLLQSNFQDQVRQLPGIGDIPILGALARSSEFLHNETELVIIVTPRLVKPVAPNMLAAPTDNFVPPSDLDIFLHGRVEAPESGQISGQASGNPAGIQAALNGDAGGGLAGPYGHIIE